MRIGSLFSGYGGLDMAAAQVFPETSVAWHSDIKPAAVALLAHRFPDAPNVGDITTVDWSRVEPVDLLTFGWPCQPHSSAGLRLGEKDPRALLPEVVRCASVLRPRILLGENVARVTSNGELRRALRAFAEIGYVGAWRCVTAAEIGAPHKRDRLALVAVRGDVPAVAPSSDQPSSVGLTLLPTPSRTDGGGGVRQLPERRTNRGKDHGPRLRDVAPTLAGREWGKYAAAIAHWESVTGRTAPDPTVQRMVSGRWQHRLAPAFVEWMMGLPAELIHVPGVEYGDRLSLLGDGVVPQQMAHGFRLALADLAQARAA